MGLVREKPVKLCNSAPVAGLQTINALVYHQKLFANCHAHSNSVTPM
jgi:hypothetical protein